MLWAAISVFNILMSTALTSTARPAPDGNAAAVQQSAAASTVRVLAPAAAAPRDGPPATRRKAQPPAAISNAGRGAATARASAAGDSASRSTEPASGATPILVRPVLTRVYRHAFDTSVGSGAPPATIGGHPMTAFAPDPSEIYSDQSSLTGPCGGAIGFSTPVNHIVIGSGWLSWSHGYTGDVYYTNGATSITITFPANTCAFYFYVEPNPLDTHTFTVTADDGSATSFQANGSAGAAFCGVFGAFLGSITIAADTGFAIGEFALACTCEPVYRACCYEAVPPAYCIEDVEIMNCWATAGRWDVGATLCSELDPPCGEYYGACCYGPIADPGYEPYQCIGDMLQWQCLFLSEYTNWTGGATCSDPFLPCPGTPIYCEAGSQFCDEYIARVQMGDIDNSSGGSAGGYTDYTTTYTLMVLPGMDYPITVTNGMPYAADVCSIWVDWNQDKTFDDAAPELIGDVTGGGVSPPYGFAMTVPGDAAPGYTRMRIRIDYANPDPDPCGTSTYGEVEDYSVLVANGQGACCNLHTGECNDDLWGSDCAALQWQFSYEQTCADLPVPCGDPGCCCAHPEPGYVVAPHPDFRANCGDGRFISGVTGADCALGVFDPECGLVTRTGVLYCPSNADNPGFRSALSALLGGAAVDFWNAHTQGTPSVAYMNPYAGVFTWADYPYADKVQMGNNIADYVDLGGRAILGQWCFPTAGNYLAGRVMSDPAYCPVLSATGYSSGSYMHDGQMCATTGVGTLNATYLDMITGLQPGATWDGHIAISYAAIWNGPMSVWYSPGNLGGTYESGDWAILTCNEVSCMPGSGPCCDILTAECRDRLLLLDCAALGAEWQWQFEGLEGEISCATLVPQCGDPGACCDIYTGECTDGVLEADCSYEHHSNQQCRELDPLCGDPGCCCDSPEPGYGAPPYFAYRANCTGRFVRLAEGEPCTSESFDPPCDWIYPGVLYCPSSADNPAFRSALSALLGAPVDFWNAHSQGTPSVDYMSMYAACFTWAEYPYADALAMGNNLAEYVDLGGRAILGQWCFQTAGNYLSGRIMSDPAYCPVASASGWGSGSYVVDGTQCATARVNSLVTHYLDNITGLRPGALSDGTFTNNAPVAAWNFSMSVWYSAGNLGGTCESGDWAILTYNEVICHNIPGPCCDIHTAECIDDVLPVECSGMGAGWRWHYVASCATLDPPCGDPGCCCDSSSWWGPHEALRANCTGRFLSGVLGADCNSRAFSPHCGSIPWGVFYAPAYGENPSFRGEISGEFGIACGTPPSGACCDPLTGDCTDDVEWADCPYVYHQQACVDLAPVCSNPGACCADGVGCVDGVPELLCSTRFAPGIPCADLTPPCPGPPPCADAFITTPGSCPAPPAAPATIAPCAPARTRSSW